jgi:hypothetical protein
MGWNTWGFEIGNTLDRRAYPALRVKRAGPPPSSSLDAAIRAGGGTITPRMRVFPLGFNETASSRRTLSSNQCQGPALIKDIALGTSTYTAPTNKSIEVGIASSRITENGVALTTPRPYTLLTELLDPFAAIVDAAGGGLLQTTSAPNMNTIRTPLDLVVLDAQFYVTIALVNNTANAQEWHGWFRVLEAIDPLNIAAYLS